MKTPLALIILVAALNAQADPLRFQYRSFPAGSVDLAPLFSYWQRELTNAALPGQTIATTHPPATPRPLPAWKLIRGKVIDVRPCSFIVDATIFTTPTDSKTQRIFLWRAPTSEKTAYEALLAQRHDLQLRKQASDRAARSAGSTASSHQASSQQFSDLAGYSTPVGPDGFSQAAAAQAETARSASVARKAALAKSQSAEAKAAELGKDLAKYSATPHAGYSVDVFALDTRKQGDGLPLFDTGITY
jgi:hypothetical protein